jgi:nitric oxide reductase subunit B
MVISHRWMQVALITFVIGFGVLGYLAYRVAKDRPPIPQRVEDSGGQVVFTGEEIMRGQHLFERYGLMQFGTIFGHGAYLGPDFTADYLHRAALAMIEYYRRQGQAPAEAGGSVRGDWRTNRYDAATGTLRITPAGAEAFEQLQRHYADYFSTPARQRGLQRPAILDAGDIHCLTSFFAWSAWAAATLRPNAPYSYTNDWPGEPLVGNYPTAEAYLWSALSLVALLGGTGLLFFLFGRYDLLGWHRDEDRPRTLQFRQMDEVRLTPAQRAVAWYYLVVAGLFLAQGLLGGVNAHYHVEPSGFYGLNLASALPYNLSRTWHVQLALFFVAASFLAMGIFIAPLIARREPRGQRGLALLLFGALVFVVVGSLIGEAMSYRGYFGNKGQWWWVGAQGWEYLDLGRLWQILLTLGMVLWLVIVVRGLWQTLPGEHPGNLPWLFIYSTLSIPLFYAAGLVFTQRSNFTVIDFWRFWVVHLWVEDFLELFTTIMVAYIFVLLGVVHIRTATRVVYLDVIIYSVGGVIGTMHHLYFSGAPAVHMALGAFFSAMEVIPLLLLSYEAWRFMRLGGAGPNESTIDTSPDKFPHKWAVMYLIAVGFWNFLGAGVFGFLINLPVISYYEIGTQFTANHAHGAMMGVYGMLAIGFLTFVARYFVPMDKGAERAMRWSFWGLNLGLGWMVFANLVPLGTWQFFDSARYGYFHARQPEFFDQTGIRIIEWLRLPGDVVFIVVGILSVCYLAVRMFLYRSRPGHIPPEAAPEMLTQAR